MTREKTVRNLLTELIDMIDNGSQRDLDRADEIGTSIIKLFEQEPCEDAVNRSDMLDAIGHGATYTTEDLQRIIKDLPPVNPQPKTGHCKECKWWKDSDGFYRRGGRAESQCPINRREVFEGNGYCYMFEPQESKGEE